MKQPLKFTMSTSLNFCWLADTWKEIHLNLILQDILESKQVFVVTQLIVETKLLYGISPEQISGTLLISEVMITFDELSRLNSFARASHQEENQI